ncbi:iron chelate uptake ABC transporter family permease subunit [Nonomuraea phyllanthi]|uniref:Iron chelate uptake ABC transporter family permease subunit n=1 Tax=Nonomuraea phyllanthi TaxID=2219224 RepID=A0A5C4V469_9ACTN|nr:iron chelate uptake ABC transporter family permease subunit [Nonomuraea phyllanthi]
MLAITTSPGSCTRTPSPGDQHDREEPGVVPRTWTPVQEQIVWEFRLPRALLALLVGAGLSVVGALLQALVRNPPADPFLLGISSGASFGAVLVLILGASALGGLSPSAAAFAGLIVPHAARLLIGADHRRVLPVTALLGAVFLQLVDVAARTVNAPRELALSIVTALFGVPFFLWPLRRRSADRAVSVT